LIALNNGSGSHS